jgi:hypothetical protein
MKKLFSTALVLLLAAFPCKLFAQAGQSGLAFLKLGTAGRGVSMADAMAASVDGAAATYYNPAGMLGGEEARTAEVLFTHREWIEDTRVEYLAGSVRVGENHALGFAVNSTTVGSIDIRTGPGEATGSFTARNFAGGLSYARRVNDDLTVGASLKFLYEKILVDESSGYGIDIGAQYRTPVDHLTVGAEVANLGRMSSLRSESSTLPSLLRIGPAYSFPIGDGTYNGLLAADLLYVFPESKSYLNCGGEFGFGNVLAVRGGYQFGSEGRGLTAGFGVRYGFVGLQYAYARLSQDLGDAHSFSVLLAL